MQYVEINMYLSHLKTKKLNLFHFKSSKTYLY